MKKIICLLMITFLVLLTACGENDQPAESQQSSLGFSGSIYQQYTQLLESKKDAILAYNWQRGEDTSRPVAICDIYGDDQPELIFFEKSEDADAGSLQFYTFSDGNTRLLFMYDKWADKDTQYYLFQKNGEKKLYGYWHKGSEDRYVSFDESIDVLNVIPKFYRKKGYDYDENGNEKLVYKYFKPGEQEATEKEYNNAVAAFEEKTAAVLMYSTAKDSDATKFAVEFDKKNGCEALTYDEAIARLSQGEGSK